MSTHRQALAAVLFLYQQVFGLRLPWMDAMDRPQRKQRLPAVLSADEVRAVLALLEGTHAVLARLLYGTGMRITEALQLRAKDVDFERRVILVRCGKGGKDRVVMLPAVLVPALKAQLQRAHGLWQSDARAGRRRLLQHRQAGEAATRSPSIPMQTRSLTDRCLGGPPAMHDEPPPHLRRAALPQQLQLSHRRVAP